MEDRGVLRLGLPSKGMEAETLDFLKSCGLRVVRPNPRQYYATIAGLPDCSVVFQRATDIYAKVDEGSLDSGITGLDVVSEHRHEGDNIVVALDDLGYARCQLMLAVPDAWVDVVSLTDLIEIAGERRGRGRELRVATKFANLVQQFLYEKGINYFSLVEAQGAIEAAPSMGYADLIADIVETGTTLRDNGLRPLPGGTILRSQACLIVNRRLLRRSERKLAAVATMLEQFEARLRARGYYSITANIRADTPEAIADALADDPATAGLLGPTIARVFSQGPAAGDLAPGQTPAAYFAATIVVEGDQLLRAVQHIRRVGGHSVSAIPLQYIYGAGCTAYDTLLEALGLSPRPGASAVPAPGERP